VDLRDYIIDPAGVDWQSLLAQWAGILPEEFNLWLVTRFGDQIVICNDGSVGFFDTGMLFFERVAASRDEFADSMDVEHNARRMLMVPMVDSCVKQGIVPGSGQCYAFKIPPFLGGQYEVPNVYVANVPEYYAFLADLWKQTRDLADGSRVRVMVK
jgi:hypothetical protein